MKKQKARCMNCNSLQNAYQIKYLGDSKWECPNCEIFKMKTKKPKFRIGQRIRHKDVSWEDKEVKFIMHGKIVGKRLIEQWGVTCWYYNILWDKSDIKKLWGVDLEDYQLQNKHPKETFFAEGSIKRIK